MSIWPCAAIFAVSLPFLMTAQPVHADGQRGGDGRSRGLALAAGQDTFRQFCAPCHGVDAKGRGPVARILTTPPADLAQAKRRNGGTFPMDRLEAVLTMARGESAGTVALGSSQMPIWGQVFASLEASPTLARARVANLLVYLESIQN